jgi:hypothetical protein
MKIGRTFKIFLIVMFVILVLFSLEYLKLHSPNKQTYPIEKANNK